MVDAAELRELISGNKEWLLVRELGRTFPIEDDVVDIAVEGDKVIFGFLDDSGWHSWRVNSFALVEREITIAVRSNFGKQQETMRLVPRTQASELAAEIERARLLKANDIAKLIEQHYGGSKAERVALNVEGGRLAQITLETREKIPLAAIGDVTEKLTVEDLFAAALPWLDKLGQRKKKPINGLLVICEKRSAKNAQKLHALLSDHWKRKISVLEIDRRAEPPSLVELPRRSIPDLWRQRSRRFRLPDRPEMSDTAARIIDLAPDDIDIVYARAGETLRYRGLPFARVRVAMGVETAWFGVGSERKLLTDNFDSCRELIDQFKTNRIADPPNSRHRLYRAAPEAWLESILRRNIQLLDGNLVLSPIYNQFRSSNDKIDLLALRRDGRLVVIELKTQPDRQSVFQAADYWRKIELQRRRGDLAAADLFGGREISNEPTLVYLAAPAWSFHRDFEYFARSLSPQIELWRFELHEDWRRQVKVIARTDYRPALT